MCRMIAVIGKNEKVNSYIDEMKNQALNGRHKEHGDGYGISYFRNGSLHTRKESCAIWERKNIYTDEDFGNIIFLHARKAGLGKVDLNNVHPFSSVVDEKTFIFMHNGTVSDIKKMGMRLKQLNNDSITDSQICFEIFQNKYQLCNDIEKSLKITIEEIAKNCEDISALNIAISDGEKLVVSRCFFDMEEYYEIFYRTDDNTTVVSTEKFGDYSDWVLLENKNIYVFETDKNIKKLDINI